MKFIIAPDKFKGSLTGFEFCNAVEEGLRMAFATAEIIKMPLADGGDGTMEIVKHYLNGERTTITVNDPLFRPIEASYLYAAESHIAYIEMAEASGLNLLNASERNCIHTSSFGTGELIAHALEKGAQEIILGIGGSATNDGGMGMAKALGFRFLDANDQELKTVGSNLMAVKKIDDSKVNVGLKKVTIKVACDVSNPFYGANGAAQVYAAQKGASPSAIAQLDAGLRNYAKVVLEKYGIDLQQIVGSGAAGGLGGGALVFLKGSLTSGIELVKELAHFDNAIKDVDWIITGEGKLDAQTLSGKTIAGVVKSAAQKKIPVAALCGSVELTPKQQTATGLTYVTAITKGVSDLQTAMSASYENLLFASYNFARVLKNGYGQF